MPLPSGRGAAAEAAGGTTTPAVNTTATPVPAPSATTATQSVSLPTPPASGSTVAVTLPAPGGIMPSLTLGSGYTAGTQIVVNAGNYGQTSSDLVSQQVAAAARAKRVFLCGMGYVTPERLAHMRAATLRKRATAITYHPKGKAQLSS